jgi:adenine phosphoribosyltransferase
MSGARGEARQASIDAIEQHIRDIHDFPKPGIVFKDWTPLMADHAAFSAAVGLLAEPFSDESIDHVIGVEARGFLLGIPVAMALGAGFVPVRKQGKLPHDTHGVTYDLEYGTDTVEMHIDAIRPGQRLLILDDLLATGGTAAATIELARMAGGDVVAASFLIELDFLNGRKQLGVDRVHSLINY